MYSPDFVVGFWFCFFPLYFEFTLEVIVCIYFSFFKFYNFFLSDAGNSTLIISYFRQAILYPNPHDSFFSSVFNIVDWIF